MKDLKEAFIHFDRNQIIKCNKCLEEMGYPALPAIQNAYKEAVNGLHKTNLIGIVVRIGGEGSVETLEYFRSFETEAETSKNIDWALMTLSSEVGDRALSSFKNDPRNNPSQTNPADQAEKMAAIQAKAATIEKLDPQDKRSIGACKEFLASDETLALKQMAISKLETSATQEAVQVLRETVESESDKKSKPRSQLTANVLAALCRMKTNAARGAVKEILESGDEPIVLVALEQLGAFGDQAVLPLLEQLESRNSSVAVQNAVKRSRAQIGMRAAAQPPVNTEDNRPRRPVNEK